MKWQYKVSLFLLFLSQVSFFGLAAYYTDSQLYYPDDNLDLTPSRGYSWIWYHPESWLICLVLVIAGLGFFVFGLVLDFKEAGWISK